MNGATDLVQVTASIRIRIALISLALTSYVMGNERPNVIVVITDDQGYGDLGCHGNPTLKTPHLDALYRESLRCTDYHVAPTCSPTRSALLTGRWPNRTGVWHTILGRSLLRPDEVTIAEVLQQAGYATGMFGKWHLGDNFPLRPEDQGFGEVLRHGGGGLGHAPDYWNNTNFGATYRHNGKDLAVAGHCTDVFFAAAREFIRKQNQQKQPFFAYIATNAPHGPMQALEVDAAPYRDLGLHVSHFFGMISHIDRQVGELRQFLRDEGLEQNTLLVFTTDNGTSSGQAIHNASMRGNKGSPYDGGHRVPCWFYWPSGKLHGGRDISPIVAHVDIFPTLLDLCGVAAPESIRLDGLSLRPLLESPSGTVSNWPDRILFTDSQRVVDPMKWRQSAVMTSDWRLVNGEELYAIRADPGQKRNVADRYPEVFRRLRTAYDAWWSELEPTFAEPTRIYLGDERENPTTLTSHDWVAPEACPWNQGQIREGLTGPELLGAWNVLVTREGTYEIRLRRWPREANLPLDASVAAEPKTPGEPSFANHEGKGISIDRASLEIGGQKLTRVVESGSHDARFRVELPAGPSPLRARFFSREGQEFGPYFVEVERLP